jgi:hypothetical protein
VNFHGYPGKRYDMSHIEKTLLLKKSGRLQDLADGEQRKTVKNGTQLVFAN